MVLIQIFLPIKDNEGKDLPAQEYISLRTLLTEKFGGITTYSRSPARGIWKEKNRTNKDEIIIYEVLVKEMDMPWWKSLKEKLEATLSQEQILIRSWPCQLIN